MIPLKHTGCYCPFSDESWDYLILLDACRYMTSLVSSTNTFSAMVFLRRFGLALLILTSL